jgi:hypothetical protein
MKQTSDLLDTLTLAVYAHFEMPFHKASAATEKPQA